MSASIIGDRLQAPGYGILPPDEGSGLLDWSWGAERLSRSHIYWIATVRPDSLAPCHASVGSLVGRCFLFQLRSPVKKDSQPGHKCPLCPEYPGRH